MMSVIVMMSVQAGGKANATPGEAEIEKYTKPGWSKINNYLAYSYPEFDRYGKIFSLIKKVF